MFKTVLTTNLGSAWLQLGRAMGLTNLTLDAIVTKHPTNLHNQIDDFLTSYKFPSFGDDKKAEDFLFEALVKASLPNIAAEVKRDLEHQLSVEGTQFFCVCLYAIPSQSCIASLFSPSHWISCMLHTSSGKMVAALP